MSININYKYMAECGEEEMLERFHRIRTRLATLPLRQITAVTKVDPVYQSLMIDRARDLDLPIPTVVGERLEGIDDSGSTIESRLRLPLALVYMGRFERGLIERFLHPVISFARETDLWDLNAYPKEIKLDFSWTVNNLALAVEFANTLLCYGYGLIVDVAEGCDPLTIALCTYRNMESPLWLGWCYTKTQYANEFKAAHALACSALDIVKEEGLLLKVVDDCEYYEHRSWKRSMKRVNEEMDFAWLGSKIIGSAVQRHQDEDDMEITTIEDNAGGLRPPWKADTSDEDDASTPSYGSE